MSAISPQPPTRRELLFWIWGGTIFLFATVVFAAGWWYTTARPDAPVSSVIDVGRPADYAPGAAPLRWQDGETGVVLWVVGADDGLRVFNGRTPNEYWVTRTGESCLFTWVEAAGEFQDPCSGDHFNRAGELVWTSPGAGERAATRDLDRFGYEISRDGRILVDLNRAIAGRPAE